MEKKNRISRFAATVPEGLRPARRLALAASFLVTLVGIVYFIALVCFAVKGKMTMPPQEDVQLFGGVVTALATIFLPILFVSVHYLTPQSGRPYSLLAVVFCMLFAAFVGINRFVQLSVVRLSVLEGNAEGLARFMPYDARSALFALEITGWGIMLGIGALFLAMALNGCGLQRAAKYVFFVYAALGLTSGVSFILNSPLSAIGFVAWGFVLFVGTGLLFFSLLKFDKHWINTTN